MRSQQIHTNTPQKKKRKKEGKREFCSQKQLLLGNKRSRNNNDIFFRTLVHQQFKNFDKYTSFLQKATTSYQLA